MSHKTTKEFHELKLPHEDGGRKNVWCVYAVDNCMLYLLNDDRYHLADLMEVNIYEDIHFDSEAECHNAAYIYYRQYNKPYPYAEEWRNSLSRYGRNTPAASDEIKSEHMTFA